MHLNVPDGPGDIKCNIRATRGLYIRGRVVKPDGKPARNASVLGCPSSGLSIDAVIDEQGEFVLGPLIEETYQVRATGRGSLGDSDPVQVEAGTRDLELRLEFAGAIRGRVVNETREPCRADILVMKASSPMAFDDERHDGSWMWTTCQEIELTGLQPGAYDLVASTLSGRMGIAKDVNVLSDSESLDVVITVRPVATLVVTARSVGVPLHFDARSGGVRVFCSLAGASTKPERIDVPSGSVVLTYWLGSGAVKTREFEVAAGKELEVVLEGKD
jgi:hypothetical protein